MTSGNKPGFEINRLNADELQYELACRGWTREGTVEEMRQSLRALFVFEKRTTSPKKSPPYAFTFAEDTVALDAKAKELETLIAVLDPSSESAVKKLRTKFIHTDGRLMRCPVDGEEEVEVHTGLIVRIGVLRQEFDRKVRRYERSLTPQPLPTDLSMVDIEPLPDSESDSEDEPEIPAHHSTLVAPAASSSTPIVVRDPRHMSLARWNLKFSGDGRGMSVTSFLERVEDKRAMESMPEVALLRGAVELFDGPARIWYRQICSTVSEWTSVARQLRQQFLPPDYDTKLFREISERKQHTTENVGMYVAMMATLFDRLSRPVSESTRVRMIVENLSPFYQSQLGTRTVSTLAELRAFGHEVEVVRYRIDAYEAPRGKSMLREMEPDLARPVGSKPPMPMIAGRGAPRINASTVECWNCRRTGHFSADCRQPRANSGVKCFKCGLDGFTTRTCTRCNDKNPFRGNQPQVRDRPTENRENPRTGNESGSRQ